MKFKMKRYQIKNYKCIQLADFSTVLLWLTHKSHGTIINLKEEKKSVKTFDDEIFKSDLFIPNSVINIYLNETIYRLFQQNKKQKKLVQLKFTKRKII